MTFETHTNANTLLRKLNAAKRDVEMYSQALPDENEDNLIHPLSFPVSHATREKIRDIILAELEPKLAALQREYDAL